MLLSHLPSIIVKSSACSSVCLSGINNKLNKYISNCEKVLRAGDSRGPAALLTGMDFNQRNMSVQAGRMFNQKGKMYDTEIKMKLKITTTLTGLDESNVKQKSCRYIEYVPELL